MVPEFLAVVVRAALQWALASLLLANGAAFCLIAAAASSLRLGPPCLLCARVHRLLSSSSSSSAAAADGSSQEHDALRRLLCDAHVAVIAVAVSPRSVPEQRLERTCSASHHVDRETDDDSEKPGGLEAHRVVSIGSEICEQDHGGDHEQPRATERNNVVRTSSIDNGGDGDGPYVSLFELAPIATLPEDNLDYVKELDQTLPESASSELAGTGGEQLTVSNLLAALRAQRRELDAARAELEAERRARAEAAECRRELEEQGELDREAVRLAMQLVHETETEKHGLQRQLDACRVKVQLYDEAAVGTGTALPPVSRLGGQLSLRRRDSDGDVMDQRGDGGAGLPEGNCSDNNYQSLVDFLPGSVYSSSPDLANLLKLYTEGNGGARRPRESDLINASAVAMVVEEVEEEVVAVTVAADSDSNGGNGETSNTSIARAYLPESGSNHVEAASS